VSGYGTAALCVLSAALGAAGATAFGLTRSNADTGQRIALVQHMVASNTERLDGVARDLSALRAASNGPRAPCPPASAASPPAPAPPDRDAVAPPAPDDTPSAAQQELVAQAEQVLDRAARQRFWSDTEREAWKRIVMQLPGPIAQDLTRRVVRGLNSNFPPRTQGPPL
jgi:hypothetical protein